MAKPRAVSDERGRKLKADETNEDDRYNKRQNEKDLFVNLRADSAEASL